MINTILTFFILLSWLLLGIIVMLCQRKLVIYSRDTKQIVAIVKPLIYAKQILHKDLDLVITTQEIKLKGNGAKIYLMEDK